MKKTNKRKIWNTARIRKTPSKPMKYLDKHGLLVGAVLDYGCGRGFDRDYYNIDGYDPYWYPVEITKKYDTVVCNYVLNVLPEEEQMKVIEGVLGLLANNGVAYFAVTREITSGHNQRYVSLDAESVYKNYWFEIYRMTNEKTLHAN